ncbi:MAG: V-type ATPase subunit [Nitrososphaerales archaeon]
MSKLSGYNDEIYTSVRASSLRGTLLSYSTLMDLVESKNIEELVTRLQATIYQPQISNLQKPYSADKLEFAFRTHLADSHFNLMRVSPGGELIRDYYYKYIVSNLKVALKGKALNRDFEELLSRIDMHAEELIGRRDLIVRVITASSLEDAGEMLKGGDFGEEVSASIKAYNQFKNIQLFDLHLDGAFLKRMMSALLRYKLLNLGDTELKPYRISSNLALDIVDVSPLLALDIDLYNTLAVLRGKLWGLSPSEIRNLIVRPTFAVSYGLLNEMILSESSQEAIKMLNQTIYSELVPTTPLSDEDSLSYLDKGFLLLTCRRAHNMLMYGSLGSFNFAFAIIKLKEIEVRNLSAIAFGVEQGMSLENIRKKLVILR